MFILVSCLRNVYDVYVIVMFGVILVNLGRMSRYSFVTFFFVNTRLNILIKLLFCMVLCICIWCCMRLMGKVVVVFMMVVVFLFVKLIVIGYISWLSDCKWFFNVSYVVKLSVKFGLMLISVGFRLWYKFFVFLLCKIFMNVLVMLL